MSFLLEFLAEGMTAAGTGRIIRLRLLGMTVREQNAQLTRESIIDRMARGEPIATPGERLDIRDYLDLALRSGFSRTACPIPISS